MDTRKFGMNYGALLGGCLVLVSLIVWILGIDEQRSVVPSILNNLLVIGFLVYAVRNYRDNFNDGFISYSQCLKLGTTVAFFSSAIVAFYTFIYITYLNPEMLYDILNMTEQSILQSDPEISDEDLDLALEMAGRFTQPHWLMMMGIISGTFMGFLYSLFISFFLKNSDPNKII